MRSNIHGSCSAPARVHQLGDGRVRGCAGGQPAEGLADPLQGRQGQARGLLQETGPPGAPSPPPAEWAPYTDCSTDRVRGTRVDMHLLLLHELGQLEACV